MFNLILPFFESVVFEAILKCEFLKLMQAHKRLCTAS